MRSAFVAGRFSFIANSASFRYNKKELFYTIRICPWEVRFMFAIVFQQVLIMFLLMLIGFIYAKATGIDRKSVV